MKNDSREDDGGVGGHGMIAVVGGTGDLGLGLSARLAGKYDVMIGSRDAGRAEEAASKVSALSGGRVSGRTNDEATRLCDIAILAIPDLPSDDVLLSMRPNLEGKLVVSPIVPMEVKDGQFRQSMQAGSAVEKVASVLRESRVAGAFHTVPAARLLEVDKALEYDVLVTAQTREVFLEVAQIASSIERLRPLYAGPLQNSRMIEGITPALLNVGRLNRIKSPSLRVV
jgi:NADPH-dependent F420 reductase